MRLEQIGAYGYGAQVARSQRKELENESDTKRGTSRFSRKDSYESVSGSIHKADSVKEVKQRMESDFYKSDVVTDDLADVFTKLFDR